MELMTNQVFRLIESSSTSAYPSGTYRVIFTTKEINKTVCVLIAPDAETKPKQVGRKKIEKTKSPRKKSPAKLVGALIWMDSEDLENLEDEKLLIRLEIEREPIYFIPIGSNKDKKIYEDRRKTMAGFLDLLHLKGQVITHGGLGGLVREAMTKTTASRPLVYKLWSILCREGLSEVSLLPRHDRCGAPNVLRPCDPGGRQKAGRKTRKQRVDRDYGIISPPKQPGMSSKWRASIIAADRQLKTAVKPLMPARIDHILKSAFVKKMRWENGRLVSIGPELGEYPNRRQIRRVLEVEIPRLQRLMEKTTKGHFKRSLRGLIARNWKGVSGPGHTWAIDSSVGDIYLRSSLNRAWIVGRPIVYIIVDVWSTAIVGFHVCLTGPSWNTAKTSIFNAVSDPALLGDMWGYEPMLSLYPYPTMCYRLMCDRGEYLSKAASVTAFALIPCMSYAPPFRPDMKGLVEVIHRIEKDAQFLFIPGAMDYRRKEFDLRNSNPDESAMTVPEYVAYLHIIFNKYNLSADRSHRVDAHMAAAGVFPSPSGLWRWGYAMGIGVQRAIPANDLIATLLESDTARVGRNSVVYAGNDYNCSTIQSEEWTAYARNFGGKNIPIHKYPGPVSRIWTPNTNGKGLLELKISDQAKTSPEVTFDELCDSIAFRQMGSAEIEHQKNLIALDALHKVEELRERAIRLTNEAMSKARGTKPTFTEARILEVSCASKPSESEAKTVESLRDDVLTAHEDMMRQMFASVN